MSEIQSTDTATGPGSMQDAASKLEGLLYPEDSNKEEPVDSEFVEVEEDAEELPESDDSSDDEEEVSDDEVVDEQEDGDYTIASLLGIDDDRIVETEDGFAVNAIIDGETRQVPLSDLVADYQLKSHVNNKSIALENQRKEFEEVRGKAAAELQERLDGVNAMSKFMEDELVSEYNSIDWDKLRVENPANWAALRQEYAEKAQRIQNTQRLAAEERERLESEQQEQMAVTAKEYMEDQHARLIRNNPEWSDDEVRGKAMTELSKFTRETYGFNEDEMKSVYDHRLIEVMKDAMAYRNGVKAAGEKRLGKKLPKFQKPSGNRQVAESLGKAREVKAKRQAVKKTGHVNDVANLIIDRM